MLAHWSNKMVTLFTAVVYYRADDGELNHQSYVRVSNEQSQSDKASDYAFNKAILERVKEITPVKVVHYWSDGAGSQFKNQYLSRLLYHKEHPSLFPSICQRKRLCIRQQCSVQKNLHSQQSDLLFFASAYCPL